MRRHIRVFMTFCLEKEFLKHAGLVCACCHRAVLVPLKNDLDGTTNAAQSVFGKR